MTTRDSYQSARDLRHEAAVAWTGQDQPRSKKPGIRNKLLCRALDYLKPFPNLP